LFPLFVTRGNLATGAINLPPISLAKFAVGAVDTGGKFATGVVDTGGAT
jgi:hypothetical protein